VIEAYLHGFFGGPALWQPLFIHADGLEGGPKGERLALRLPFHGGPQAANFDQSCRQLWQDPILSQAAKPVHLVGYSLGARLALAMACQEPTAVGALTLIGVNPGLQDRAARMQRLNADARWAELLSQRDVASFAARWDAQPIFAHRAALSAQQRRLLNAERLGHDPLALKEALRVLGVGAMADLWPNWPIWPFPCISSLAARTLNFCAWRQRSARSCRMGCCR